MRNVAECMLVDDDLDDQEIFVMALEKVSNEVHCTTAINGVEALRKLNDDEGSVPGWIFLDVNMPKMNGLQCLAEIRKMEKLRDVPVYMFSTSSDLDMVRRARELGANDFLLKPVKLDTLVEMLRAIIKN